MIEKFKDFELKVKKLSLANLDEVYKICKNNKKYYSEYLKQASTRAEAKTIFTDIPPNITQSQKYVLGFYQIEEMVAFADIVLGYPDKNSATIGLLMVDPDFQRCGFGSKIAQKILTALKEKNFKNIEIGVINNNIEGLNFWEKQGFKQYATKQVEDLILVKMRKG